jgi:hypothetical protein
MLVNRTAAETCKQLDNVPAACMCKTGNTPTREDG